MTPDTAKTAQAVLAAPDGTSPIWEFQKSTPTASDFCSNHEGWGPLSPTRFDLTPCFLDAWIMAFAAIGIVCGGGAIFYLKQKRKPAPVKRDWQFVTKLVFLALTLTGTIVQALIQIRHGILDFRFLTTLVVAGSVCIIATVQFLEHNRSRVPNGVVLFFWLFYIVIYAIKIRSLVSLQEYRMRADYFIVVCITTACAILNFAVEWLVPKTLSGYEHLQSEKECPYEYANVFSVLAFSWMTPMMKYGYSQYLTQNDLWDLRARDKTKSALESFDEAYEQEHESEYRQPSLWFALFRAYGGPFARGSIYKTFSDCFNFMQPQLLRLLITFVESYRTDNPQPIARGAAIAIGMFLVSVCQTVSLNQYFQRAFETGMRVKAGLTAAIYIKSMKLSNEGRAAKSSGDIVNYMAVDTQRLQDLCQFGQMVWSAPFQIVLCLLSLYQLVGISMLAGVGIMILMIPINGLLAKIMKTLQKRMMHTKDSRTRLMTEILNNMKSIKLYAWNSAFINKLNFIRNDQELKTLRQIGAAQAFSTFAWSTTPFLVSCSTFLVYVLMEDAPLTTDIIFPALTLFNLLTFPLAVLPMVITSIVESMVAVNRLTEYLNSDEIQTNAVTAKGAVEKHGDEAVRVSRASFTWDRYQDQHVLEDIEFSSRKGDLSCIVGRVGSGKSSLLESMLGNLYKTKGEVIVHGAVAYVSQSAWVMNASVKENILFGHRWDPQFYDKTVKACALSEDFASLPDGDKTEVGERGISLSGGQKARLTLARAVYARADIYLLDDVLSAVDGHVGRHLIENVLGPRGLLAGKCRILATNSIPVLADADHIDLLRAGRITESGTYSELMAKKGSGVADLVHTSNDEESDEADDIEDGEKPPLEDRRTGVSEDQATEDKELESIEAEEEEEEMEMHEGVSHLQPIRPNAGGSVMRKDSSMTLRRASTASFRGPRGKATEEEEGVAKTKQSEEKSEQGKVKWDVYLEYAKTSNIVAVTIYLVMLILAQTTQIAGSVWLKFWAEVNDAVGGNPDIVYFVGVYFAFGVGSSLLTVVQTLVLWIFCSIEASRKLHERMALAMFRSPMSFFETTPAGRILNRFSSDIYRVDEVVARTFNMLFVNSARALFTLGLVSVSTPVFIAMILPLTALYLYIQRYYLRTSRELKRLDSVTRSPVYAHFQESLSGLSVIRAFRQQKRFSMENEWRVDANLSAYFPAISANRWLAVRLEFIGAVIIFTSAAFSIISVASHSGLSAGLVGLSMSYALQITSSLNWIVRQTVEVETNIVSVERVLEYSRLPSEAPEVIPNNRPPLSWPAKGAVRFENYSTKYRENLDPVLHNINLDIAPHEKIGVVGRTGAGKSSLTLSLFRIIEPTEGCVVIDDVNTSNIGLVDLRRRLAIIPQDAALFQGTIRDNLDPGHVHDDTELWSVLEHARLKEHVSNMTGKLDAAVHEAGSNLSQGQRQLVSLARALLTPSNILVLDEATAAVDVQTDALLQTTLRSAAFQHRTIITIAHRINTILDSDRIVVLDKGRVAEFDTPSALIQKKGVFYSLAKEAGLAEVVGKEGQ